MSWLNTEETNCNTTIANMHQYTIRYHSTKIYTKKTITPALVAFYDLPSGNGASTFLQSWNPHVGREPVTTYQNANGWLADIQSIHGPVAETVSLFTPKDRKGSASTARNAHSKIQKLGQTMRVWDSDPWPDPKLLTQFQLCSGLQAGMTTCLNEGVHDVKTCLSAVRDPRYIHSK